MSQAITPLRLAVWNGLLDAERYVRYYGALAKRYRYQQQIPRWIMALAAVTGAMPMVFGEFFPPDVSAATGLIVLGAVAWDLVSGHGHKPPFSTPFASNVGSMRRSFGICGSKLSRARSGQSN